MVSTSGYILLVYECDRECLLCRLGRVTFGVKADPSTVYRWTIKCCRILLEVEKQILPTMRKLGLTWHGDEVVVKLGAESRHLSPQTS